MAVFVQSTTISRTAFVQSLSIVVVSVCASAAMQVVDWNSEVTRLLAQARQHQQRYPDVALELLSQAEDIARKHLGEEDWRTREAQSGIEQITRWSRLSPADLRQLERATDDCHRAMKLRHQQGAQVVIQHQRRAVAEIERIVGRGAREYVFELDNLAGLELECGKAPEAFGMRLDALKVFGDKLGFEHPTAARGIMHTGLTIDRMGHPAVAKPLLSRALAAMVAAGVEGSVRAAASLHLATNAVRLSKYEDALIHLHEASGVHDDESDPLQKRMILAGISTIRAIALDRLGRSADAVAEVGRAIAIYDESVPTSPNVLDAQIALARCKVSAGEVKEASRILDAIQSDNGVRSANLVENVCMVRSRIFFELGQFVEENRSLRMAMEAAIGLSRSDHLNNAFCLRRLAELERDENPTEADALVAKANGLVLAHRAAADEILHRLELVGIVFTEVERTEMKENSEAMYNSDHARGIREPVRVAKKPKASPARK